MALTLIGKLYGGLQANKNGIINTSIKYIYLFNDAESPLDVYNDSGLPAKNSQYPSASGSGKGLYALRASISGPEEGDGARSGRYVATVPYTNDLRLNNTEESTEDQIAPWKMPPYDISIYPIDVTKSFVQGYAEKDKKGSPSVPVLNAAGDPVDAQTVEQNTVYRFSYNLQDFDDSWIDEFADTVNDGDVAVIDKTVPKQKGRMRNLDATFQRIYKENGDILYKYWKVNIEIEKSANIWEVKFMELGLWFIDTNDASKKKRIYTDGDGNFGGKIDLIADGADADDVEAVDTPQKLNLDGSLYVGATAEYTTYNEKAIVNWGSLSLPETISGQSSTSRLGLL